MRDEYQKMTTSDGVYSLPQNFRPYLAEMKKIFRNREQSNSSFDNEQDMLESSSEQNE